MTQSKINSFWNQKLVAQFAKVWRTTASLISRHLPCTVERRSHLCTHPHLLQVRHGLLQRFAHTHSHQNKKFSPKKTKRRIKLLIREHAKRWELMLQVICTLWKKLEVNQHASTLSNMPNSVLISSVIKKPRKSSRKSLNSNTKVFRSAMLIKPKISKLRSRELVIKQPRNPLWKLPNKRHARLNLIMYLKMPVLLQHSHSKNTWKKLLHSLVSLWLLVVLHAAWLDLSSSHLLSHSWCSLQVQEVSSWLATTSYHQLPLRWHLSLSFWSLLFLSVSWLHGFHTNSFKPGLYPSSEDGLVLFLSCSYSKWLVSRTKTSS